MKSIPFFMIVLFSFTLFNTQTEACTSAVFSGKCTPDGRPLLWKNRDTSVEQNALMYFNDGKYEYMGLINAKDKQGDKIWAGYNSTGFAIMNTASYNLILEDTVKTKNREGIVMKLALQYCTSLADFEHLLDTMSKPMGLEANFGVIDGQGGAAFYETDNFSYNKIDVNDPAIAPFGYVVRSNFSFTGKHDEGHGYIRYLAADKLLYNAVATNNLTVPFIIQDVTRSLTHGLTEINLKEVGQQNSEAQKFVHFEDFIPRYTSTASIVIQGTKKGESAELTTMWTVLGFPLTSVLTPVWLAGGDHLPAILTSQGDSAPLCENVLKLKRLVFPITRGSGKKYMDIHQLYNAGNTGIMQKLKPVEDKIYEMTMLQLNAWRKSGIDKKEMLAHYDWMEKEIKDAFKTFFSLTIE